MDPYAHANCDQLTECLGTLYQAMRKNADTVIQTWQSIPLPIRAAAGDLDALDELHGGTQ